MNSSFSNTSNNCPLPANHTRQFGNHKKIEFVCCVLVKAACGHKPGRKEVYTFLKRFHKSNSA